LEKAVENYFGIKKMALLTGCKAHDPNTLLGKNALHCCLLVNMPLPICTKGQSRLRKLTTYQGV
jgi:hypothetical protein